MDAEAKSGTTGDEGSETPILEGTVALLALLAIYLLGVWSDPLGPFGGVVLIPFAVLVVTYVLAFGSLVRRVT